MGKSGSAARPQGVDVLAPTELPRYGGQPRRPWRCSCLTPSVLLPIGKYWHEPLRTGRFRTVCLPHGQTNQTFEWSPNTLVENPVNSETPGVKSSLEESYLGSCATSIPFTHAIPVTGTKLRFILPCALGRIPEKVRSRGRPSPPASLYMSKFLSRATPLQ